MSAYPGHPGKDAAKWLSILLYTIIHIIYVHHNNHKLRHLSQSMPINYYTVWRNITNQWLHVPTLYNHQSFCSLPKRYKRKMAWPSCSNHWWLTTLRLTGQWGIPASSWSAVSSGWLHLHPDYMGAAARTKRPGWLICWQASSQLLRQSNGQQA